MRISDWSSDVCSSDLGLYAGGLSVRTTLDPRLQGIAKRVLREGLIAYDRRHGWRGPLQAVPVGEGADVAALLQQIERPAGISDTWQLAAVLATDARQADIILADGSKIGRASCRESVGQYV